MRPIGLKLLNAGSHKCEGRKGYAETAEGAGILKEIRRLRRKRKGRVRRTYNEIAEILNAQGFRATNGKPFTGDTVICILYRQKKRRSIRKEKEIIKPSACEQQASVTTICIGGIFAKKKIHV